MDRWLSPICRCPHQERKQYQSCKKGRITARESDDLLGPLSTLVRQVHCGHPPPTRSNTQRNPSQEKRPAKPQSHSTFISRLPNSPSIHPTRSSLHRNRPLLRRPLLSQHPNQLLLQQTPQTPTSHHPHPPKLNRHSSQRPRPSHCQYRAQTPRSLFHDRLKLSLPLPSRSSLCCSAPPLVSSAPPRHLWLHRLGFHHPRSGAESTQVSSCISSRLTIQKSPEDEDYAPPVDDWPRL